VNGIIDFWDGRDDSGNIVPNGVYFYRVDVDSDTPLFGKVMVLQ
jgi:flagellar hook assembly protein FlgD